MSTLEIQVSNSKDAVRIRDCFIDQFLRYFLIHSESQRRLLAGSACE